MAPILGSLFTIIVVLDIQQNRNILMKKLIVFYCLIVLSFASVSASGQYQRLDEDGMDQELGIEVLSTEGIRRVNRFSIEYGLGAEAREGLERKISSDESLSLLPVEDGDFVFLQEANVVLGALAYAHKRANDGWRESCDKKKAAMDELREMKRKKERQQCCGLGTEYVTCALAGTVRVTALGLYYLIRAINEGAVGSTCES